LVAALLLFAPLAGTAWNAHAAACCTGEHFPIPEHHHSKAPTHGADCEHQTDGMTACTMSCCHNTDHVMLMASAFVVPAGASLPKPDLTILPSQWPPQTAFRVLSKFSPLLLDCQQPRSNWLFSFPE
jgi:hypothetical protein